jgi:long-subunit acyl-CoA synthetase (AMP-forming)
MVIYEVFGQSEGTGMTTLNSPLAWKMGTVGTTTLSLTQGEQASGDVILLVEGLNVVLCAMCVLWL